MKYFFLPLFLILLSCSLEKNSTFWNSSTSKKTVKVKNVIKSLPKTDNFETMNFEEFSLFLKNYSDKNNYPDINN